MIFIGDPAIDSSELTFAAGKITLVKTARAGRTKFHSMEWSE